MESVWQDIRYALRTLRLNPGLALIAILTVAIGIGANTAIFSVVYGVLFRPLPYSQPDQIVRVWRFRPDLGDRAPAVSVNDFNGWTERNHSFSNVGAYSPRTVQLNFTPGAGEGDEIQATDVSATLMDVLGVAPIRGRSLAAGDDKPGSNAKLLISYRLWQSKLHGDPNVVGRTVAVQNQTNVIVGVMPPNFQFPDNQDVWFPREFTIPAMPSGVRIELANLIVIARLKPNVSLEMARDDLKSITTQMDHDRQMPMAAPVVTMRLADAIVGNVRPTLLIFLGAVGLVLLIACANVANLLLARADSREREFAIRASLGAARSRLTRQMLTESWILAGLGAIAGVGLALAGTKLFIAYNPGNIPRVAEVRMDGTVLLFMAAMVIVTGILFGLAPALRLSRTDLSGTLKLSGITGTRSGNAGRGHWLRNALVVNEIAFSLVLLVSAGLLIRSFMHLATMNPGFNPRNVITAGLRPTGRAADAATSQQACRELLDRVRGIDGVDAAAMSIMLPGSGMMMRMTYGIPGSAPTRQEDAPTAMVVEASDGYFKAMGIPIIAGQDFTEQDVADNRAVAVSESFARKNYSGRDAVGQQVLMGPQPSNIIAVVADVHQMGLKSDPAPMIYRPGLSGAVAMGGMKFARPLNLIVRTRADSQKTIPAVRGVLAQVAADFRAQNMSLLDVTLSESIAEPRFYSVLLGMMAAVALALALIGTYGVLSYIVTGRTREIGIRVALGAQTRDVMKLVMGQAILLATLGVGVGLIGAWAATRLLKKLLFGVSTTDPTTFIAVSALLAAAALAACYIPARRATRVDPLTALRYE